MSCHWVNSGLRDRSRAYTITIAFSFGRELCRACKCVAIRNKVKNLLTWQEKGEENQWIDQCKKPLNPVGKLKEEKSKDEKNCLIDLLLVKNLLIW